MGQISVVSATPGRDSFLFTYRPELSNQTQLKHISSRQLAVPWGSTLEQKAQSILQAEDLKGKGLRCQKPSSTAVKGMSIYKQIIPTFQQQARGIGCNFPSPDSLDPASQRGRLAPAPGAARHGRQVAPLAAAPLPGLLPSPPDLPPALYQHQHLPHQPIASPYSFASLTTTFGTRFVPICKSNLLFQDTNINLLTHSFQTLLLSRTVISILHQHLFRSLIWLLK